MDEQKLLAQRIKSFRESKEMSQAELAQKTHIERTALNKIEKGNRKVSSDELKAIALALNVSTDLLLNIQDKEEISGNVPLTWADLGMPYGGKIPEDLKETYVDIAQGYFRRHPEMLNKDK